MSGSHLVARGVSELTTRMRNVQTYDGPVRIEFPAWGYFLILVTTVAATLTYWGISYTYGEVVATLAMIEQPQSTAIIETPPEDQESGAPLLKGDEKLRAENEILVVQSKPITSSWRAIIKHLRQRAGRASRFRGLHIYIATSLVSGLMENVLFGAFGKSILSAILIHVFVAVGVCRLNLLWNHMVISEPSEKSWFRRVLNRKQAWKIVLPTAVFAFVEASTVNFLLQTLIRLDIKAIKSLCRRNPSVDIALLRSQEFTLVLSILAVIFIAIPSTIMITRIRASLLAPEEEPIVPFDRTFGGKVVTSAPGSKGRLGIWQSFKTVDWASFSRVFKIYNKVAIVQFAIICLWVIAVGAELHFIGGEKLLTQIKEAVQKQH